MAEIRIEDLGSRFEHFELREISETIPRGRITAIVGRNGSGKSTLLRVLARLTKPDKGQIRYDDVPIGAYSRKEFAQLVSLLSQEKGHVPDVTVRELVAYGRAPRQSMFRYRPTPEDEKAIDWALSTTGIRHNEYRLFHTMSGGEQQKARIAMALAQESSVLLLDEPTTYLDLSHQLEIMEMLKSLNRKLNLTIVMVLHDLQQAAAYCDHLIAMENGRVAVSGPPRAVINRRFMLNVFGVVAKVDLRGDYPIIIPIPQPVKEESSMVIVTNVSQITKGSGMLLIERFNKAGKVEGMKGFLGLEVMLTENTKEYDEVTVSTRWETKEDFQAWTKSEAFRESHAHRQTPEYILSNKIVFYDVKVVRQPLEQVESPSA
ncbi:heme oxygenase [Cohnella thailandensis]|uniref:Heme-degrading monooxygenase n=1 Tax=Cohnella thailandensis TaxID=557557 RepID=A0A841SXN2_9BACL|nr:heme oxygenase [Cohnella thailandensis]MBB6634938.1 heme oxygenase [Cohnella thailandensis]MBP1975840.1 heme oxygenase (staphylobilin-producing) [Cohnella thailandensis]